jgi:hypothetical protein
MNNMEINGTIKVAGSVGTNGQVLTSNGITAYWTTPDYSNLAVSTSVNMNEIKFDGETIDFSSNTFNISSNQINISSNLVSINGNLTLSDVSLNNFSVLQKATFSNDVSMNNLNVNGILKVAGSVGTSGQVLTSNGTVASWTTPIGGWIGTATTDLNMNNKNISNVLSIDASGTSLSIGNTSSTGITIGKTGITTTINGRSSLLDVSLNNFSVLQKATFSNDVSMNNLNVNGILQVAGSVGTSGQVLTSNGTVASWSTPTGGWSGTATSNLNMNNNTIINTRLIDASGTSLSIGNTSSTSITIGKTGITTTINGTTSINETKTSTINTITSGTLSIGSNALTTGIDLNHKALSGITLGVNEYIDCNVNTTLPTKNSRIIGSMYDFSSTINETTSLTATYISISASNIVLPVGIYIVSGTIIILPEAGTGNTNITYVNVAVGTAVGNQTYGIFQLGRGVMAAQGAAQYWGVSVNCICEVTTIGKIHVSAIGLNDTAGVSLFISNESYIRSVRIA